MNRKLLVGIDEAGRGPVIGPMALCAVGVYSKRSPLFSLPLKDSKKLKPVARQALFPAILQHADLVYLEMVPPERIDQVSLTQIWLSFVLAFCQKVKPREILLDAPVSKKALLATKKALSFRLKKQRTSAKVILEHKADEKFPLVSAASIVAKVSRDAYIAYLHTLYGDFGSGYPSDPKTRAFVQSHPNLPIIRKKWKLKGTKSYEKRN